MNSLHEFVHELVSGLLPSLPGYAMQLAHGSRFLHGHGNADSVQLHIFNTSEWPIFFRAVCENETCSGRKSLSENALNATGCSDFCIILAATMHKFRSYLITDLITIKPKGKQ
jgi:hypothetical protein